MTASGKESGRKMKQLRWRWGLPKRIRKMKDGQITAQRGGKQESPPNSPQIPPKKRTLKLITEQDK